MLPVWSLSSDGLQTSLQVLTWCKSAQRKNCQNWSFQGMVSFYLHNLHQYPSRPSSCFTARLQAPRVWGCAQIEESEPSWVALAPATQQLCWEELCWLPWGRVTEKVTENSQGEPTQFAICFLTALSTSFVVHSSVQFKLWSFMALVRTSGHFSTKSSLLSIQRRTQSLLCKLEACSSLCYSN